MRVWSAGGCPLLGFTGFWVESPDETARKVTVVDQAVRIVRDSAWACALVRQYEFSNIKRFWINLPDLIAAKFAKVCGAVWPNDDAIRQRVQGGYILEGNLAGLHIQFSHKVAFLNSEEDHSLLVEHQAMRIARTRIGHRVFRYFTGARSEFANVSLEIRREPNVAFSIGSKSVRSGVGRFQRILLNLARLWIQSAQFVC